MPKVTKRRVMPTFEIITNKKAPPRVTTPKSFYRDLIGSMKAGDWFVLDSEDKSKVLYKACKMFYRLLTHCTVILILANIE